LTQFIVLTVFTILISMLLYFYPSSIPVKTKMIYLGMAFLLAAGGLVALDIFSYWITLALLISVNFIASYFLEKKMAVIGSVIEKAGIIPSFEKITFIETKEMLDDTIKTVGMEHAAAVKEIEIAAVSPERLEDLENVTRLEELNDISDAEDTLHSTEPIEFAIEDDFAFLDKEREQLVEDATDSIVPEETSIEEIHIKREGWLCKLEELEELDFLSEKEEHINLSNESPLLEAGEQEISEEMETILSDINAEAEIQETEHAEKTTDEGSVIPVELVEEMAALEEIAVLDGSLNSVMEEKTDEAAVQAEEEIPIVQEDLDFAVQDMLLNTLKYYQEQSDHDSYHAMLESVLSQNLSDKDFYLFSKLLLESYFQLGNNVKLDTLVGKMNERLSVYLVIAEEIKQFQLQKN
jgi:hypothetical protein